MEHVNRLPTMDELHDVSFVVTATPAPQPRQRHGAVVDGEGHAKSFNYTDPRSRVHEFKREVRVAARESMVASGHYLFDGPLHLGIQFILPRPQSLNRKKGPNDRVPHDRKNADVDNLVKAVMDACNGIVWYDDSQVASLYATKDVAALGESPHAVVLVQQVFTTRRHPHAQTRQAQQDSSPHGV